uniref:hypothetical protein n=1 Tax=Halomonas sp. TaxID=1486246 RepID=UPI00260819D9|nr:hypothetical protein [Halomonas sp.]
MAETDQMLKAVLVMQAEILGRLDSIERHIQADQSWHNESRGEALAAMEYIADCDIGKEIWKDLQPIIRKISAFQDH